MKKSLLATQKQVERYNRLADQIEATEAKLRRLHQQQDTAREKLFKTLPERHGIVMGERFTISSWDQEKAVV